jgi:hypothetical protein
MDSRRRFNYDEFVRGWRAACTRRGIDPAEGATSYQVATLVAERRKAAAKQHCAQDRWWQKHTFWFCCPPYHSDTEADALWQVFVQAYAILGKRVAYAARLRRAEMALAELQAYQTQGK